MAVQAEMVQRTRAALSQWRLDNGGKQPGLPSQDHGASPLETVSWLLGEQSHIMGYGAQQWGQVRILPCAPSGMEQEEGLWAWPGFWDMDQSPMVWYGVTSECQSVTKARGVHTGHPFPTCPILAPQEVLQQT